MEQIDYNFSKSEKAKGTQKRAAIGNLVFDTDSQCCPIDLISCIIVSNRQDACSTKDKFSCGTGILPVHKRLIDNGATSEIDRPQVRSRGGKPRNCRSLLIHNWQSQPNNTEAASLSSSEKSSIATRSSPGRCQLILGLEAAAADLPGSRTQVRRWVWGEGTHLGESADWPGVSVIGAGFAIALKDITDPNSVGLTSKVRSNRFICRPSELQRIQ